MSDLASVITGLMGGDVLRAGKAAYPKFKAEMNATPGRALEEMAQYEKDNPLGSALSFTGNVVAGKGARAFKQAESVGRVFGGVADQLPRFEVADKMAQMRSLPEIGKEGKLSEILDHPELYYNYPDLKDLSVRKMAPTFENAGKTGAYGLDAAGKPLIEIGGGRSAEELKSSLLHEIQHAIQEKEGFAQGEHGDSPKYKGNPGEMEARAVSRRMNLSPAALEASPIRDFILKMERMKS